MQRDPARSMYAVLALTVGGLLGSSVPALGDPAAPAAAPRVDESQPTEAALRAIAQHWGDAETGGEVAYLEQLLAPEYRSIDPKGVSHPRAKILEHARHAVGSADARKATEAFLQAHPTEMAVVLHGELGIVSYFNPKRGLDTSIRGSDMFVYEGNRWHAVFSMHNSAD